MKNERWIFVLLAISGMAQFRCGGDEDIIIFTVEQTARLLSNDTTKTWEITQRVVDGVTDELDVCELNTRLIFVKGSSLAGDSIILVDDCSQEPVISGYWQVINVEEASPADTLFFLLNPDTVILEDESVEVRYDTLLNVIENISAQNLIIHRLGTFNQSPDNILESYNFEIE